MVRVEQRGAAEVGNFGTDLDDPLRLRGVTLLALGHATPPARGRRVVKKDWNGSDCPVI
jgi:hypothetical protein